MAGLGAEANSSSENEPVGREGLKLWWDFTRFVGGPGAEEISSSEDEPIGHDCLKLWLDLTPMLLNRVASFQ